MAAAPSIATRSTVNMPLTKRTNQPALPGGRGGGL